MKPLVAICCSYSPPEGSAKSGLNAVPHAYSSCVARAGGVPLLIPRIDEPETVSELLERVDAVIISGGVDIDPIQYGKEPLRTLGQISPERDDLDRAVVGYVLANAMLPVLGICRGIQALNAFAGGSLHQDIPSCTGSQLQHSQKAPGWYGTHSIDIEGDSRLSRALQTTAIRTNSFHHQAVDQLAPGFRIAARSTDGVVEAIEREACPFCVGVQFHPELMAESGGQMMALFETFVREACAYRASKG